MLADGSLDLAFALEAEPPEGLERLELSNEELDRRDESERMRWPVCGPLPVAELAGQPLIAFQPGSSTRQVLDAALAGAGVEAKIALEANDLALRALARLARDRGSRPAALVRGAAGSAGLDPPACPGARTPRRAVVATGPASVARRPGVRGLRLGHRPGG